MNSRARLPFVFAIAACLVVGSFSTAQAANRSGVVNRFTGTDGIEFVCTSGMSFSVIPNMTRTFTLSGSSSSSVVVTFSGSLSLSSTQNDTGFIRLTIDNQVQGPGDQVPVIGNEDVVSGAVREDGSHSFTWQTGVLRPGPHTARVLWRSDMGSEFCADARSLIVLHR